MITLLPQSSPADTAGAYAILAVIADPAAAKKRLDELVKERAATEQALADMRELTVKAQAAQKAATAAQDAADKQIAANGKMLNDLEARSAALERRESDAKARDAELKKQSAALAKAKTNQEADLSGRGEALKAKEAEAVHALAQANAYRQEYTDKIARLKEVTG